MSLQGFLKLPPEKQEAILAAALAEFVEHGFALASTNRMVERAGISKGVLFKYFQSKESLFLFLVEREARLEEQANQNLLQRLPPDFFAALRFVAQHQLARRAAEPARYALFEQVMAATEPPVMRQAQAMLAQTGLEVYRRLMQRLERGTLRRDVPYDKVMNLVLWVAEGVKQQYRRPGAKAEPEVVLAELDLYFDLLKRGLY